MDRSFDSVALSIVETDHLKKFEALLTIAGFQLNANMYKLINGRSGHGYPSWYLFETTLGKIQMGWRKRVIHIEWFETGAKIPNLTNDEVTKDDTYGHAWGYGIALDYLETLHRILSERDSNKVPLVRKDIQIEYQKLLAEHTNLKLERDKLAGELDRIKSCAKLV